MVWQTVMALVGSYLAIVVAFALGTFNLHTIGPIFAPSGEESIRRIWSRGYGRHPKRSLLVLPAVWPAILLALLIFGPMEAEVIQGIALGTIGLLSWVIILNAVVAVVSLVIWILERLL
jgi:hypothetical protein